MWNINGCIVQLGTKPVAQFQEHRFAWEYAKFLADSNKGRSVTLLSKEGYCTQVSDAIDEGQPLKED